MRMVETHIVPSGVEKIRVDHYTRHVFDFFPSLKSIRKAIKRGEIRIDGKTCMPNATIQPGQLLELADPELPPPKPFRIPLKVFYEDSWLAIIEKPPGIPVRGNKFRTVENALQCNLEPTDKQDALKWPNPVHRLDTPTGGLLIAAKTSLAQVKLGWQFQNREVQKRYRAIVIGRLEGSGCTREPVDGRDALTDYHAIKHVQSLKSDWLTLMDLWPRTGRPHQIRRHLSQLGFPILGDRLYGIEGKILRSKGLFLWAVEVSFRHPILQWQLTIRIDEPRKFNTLLEREKLRWKRYNDA
jgi:23S rRNA pseudouridine1911/1915/1917 synthase